MSNVFGNVTQSSRNRIHETATPLYNMYGTMVSMGGGQAGYTQGWIGVPKGVDVVENIISTVEEVKVIENVQNVHSFAANGELPAKIFSSKAPVQVTPGITELSGQYINDLGIVQPWKASYDIFGRLIERTDWNAANKAHGIDAIHHHIYEYLSKIQIKSIDHIPGVGPKTGR